MTHGTVRLWFVVVGSMIGLLLATVSGADENVSPEQATADSQVQRLFDQGTTCVEENCLSDALAAFRQARKLVVTPSLNLKVVTTLKAIVEERDLGPHCAWVHCAQSVSSGTEPSAPRLTSERAAESLMSEYEKYFTGDPDPAPSPDQRLTAEVAYRSARQYLYEYHLNAGKSLYSKGKNDAAVIELRKAGALQPEPEIHRVLIHVYRAAGDYEAAIRECESYLEARPLPPETGQVQVELAELKYLTAGVFRLEALGEFGFWWNSSKGSHLLTPPSGPKFTVGGTLRVRIVELSWNPIGLAFYLEGHIAGALGNGSPLMPLTGSAVAQLRIGSVQSFLTAALGLSVGGIYWAGDRMSAPGLGDHEQRSPWTDAMLGGIVRLSYNRRLGTKTSIQRKMTWTIGLEGRLLYGEGQGFEATKYTSKGPFINPNDPSCPLGDLRFSCHFSAEPQKLPALDVSPAFSIAAVVGLEGFIF